MIGKLLKGVLLLAVLVLLGLIAVNGHLTGKNLERIRAATAQQAQIAQQQAALQQLMVDVGEIQSGHQGYILTDDTSYLTPYTAASGRLPEDITTLRTALADRAQEDRDRITHVEKLMSSKLSEAERSIHWRQQGYRHRAFVIVESGEGKGYTDQARQELNALADSVAGSRFQYDRELQESFAQASRTSRLAHTAMIALSVLLFLLLVAYLRRSERERAEVVRRLEREAADATAGWKDAQNRLQGFQDTIAQDLRGTLGEVQEHADQLIQRWGDYLPQSGQEQAQRMSELTGQTRQLVERVLQKESA